eukprot:9535144-Lingulodinium_polyedra.AAC.1
MFGITEAEPSLGTTSLVKPATWPFCPAQSGQAVAAGAALLRACAEHGRAEAVSGCWKCARVPPGTLL